MDLLHLHSIADNVTQLSTDVVVIVMTTLKKLNVSHKESYDSEAPAFTGLSLSVPSTFRFLPTEKTQLHSVYLN